MLILNNNIAVCFFFCLFASSSDNFLIVIDFVLSILSRLTLEFKFEIWEFAWEFRMSREMAEERIGKGIRYK